jgi:GNAT superfamily N-acetyltransferase
MRTLRPTRDGDFTTLLDIINAAAEAYRGVIPADRWHEPYMTADALAGEIAAGVEFWACVEHRELLGVMGIQRVRDVNLIRHAYVRPGAQRGGVGRALLSHFCAHSPQRLLVGTWSDAHWAIDFYRRGGFRLAPPDRARALLRQYWSIPDRQIETSVVPEYSRGDADRHHDTGRHLV